LTRYRRSPRPLAGAFAQLRDDVAPATLLADVQRIWSTTVGEAIAAEAAPTAERGGVLTVTCSASVWAQELDLMAPMILERLNGALSGRPLQRLRCVAV
jgi:predicted nucleic acid-binding Zn ribbon protein